MSTTAELKVRWATNTRREITKGPHIITPLRRRLRPSKRWQPERKTIRMNGETHAMCMQTREGSTTTGAEGHA